MSRPKSEFLKALGTMFEIWKALTEEVLSMGGTDDDIRRIGTNCALRTKIAQLVVSGRIAKLSYELYLAPAQRGGVHITGFDLDQHLKSDGLIERTFALDDPLIKGWLADPSSYPEEFKGKAVLLWKSQCGSGRDRDVAFLVWGGDHVVASWSWLGSRLFGRPVLLANS